MGTPSGLFAVGEVALLWVLVRVLVLCVGVDFGLFAVGEVALWSSLRLLKKYRDLYLKVRDLYFRVRVPVLVFIASQRA
jgi:hypothetical protein